ncbi:MAG: type II toxin-antitoxin system VapC family toxin [Calditrichaeota bacterium]|nr:MAG: type II toxin-antitoxin system VapC family toxin [Calditrichota bacterium]
MSKSLLVDTDILIDVAREEITAINRLRLEESKSNLQISSITKMELIVGCANKRELNILSKFLKRYEILSLSEEISEKAIKLLSNYRLSHGLLIPDSIIAATAITLKVPFLSKNQKDYRFIKELELLSYP